MICIFLVAGHNLLLESEISVIINDIHGFYGKFDYFQADKSGKYVNLIGRYYPPDLATPKKPSWIAGGT